MMDVEKLISQGFAITGKLNSLVLLMISHPDREKKIESLKVLHKRLSSVVKFLTDYLIAVDLINAHKTL